MSSNPSVTFFDTQFQKQVAAGDFALNPFEKAVLPFLRGRVLDFGCGLGNLGIEAARRGLKVVAVDASATAIERIGATARAGSLSIKADCADVERYSIPGEFDTIVAIGLLMFFRKEKALELLSEIQRHVAPGGLAVVNVLIESTTYMGMFEPGNFYLFGKNELQERFKGWKVIHLSHDSFDAPGGTKKEFVTLVAQKDMRTIRHYVDLRAQEQPDAPYLIAPETGSTLTFGQLKRDSEELGRYLAGQGLAKGDKVALMLPNSYQAARLFIGVMYAGYTVTPLNLLAQVSQLAYVLEHSDSKLVFTGAEQVPQLSAALKKINNKIKYLVIDPDAASILKGASAASAALPAVSEDDDAMLMYTSGTTGKPKGCVLSHRSVIVGGEYTSAAHALSKDDRVLCAMPLYHINGQIVTAVAPLVHGGSVVMPHRFSASNYWDLVAKYRCTWINVVPTIIAYLLNGPDPRDKGLAAGQVKFCRSASAPLPPDLHRAFEKKFGIGIIETFGMTETNAPCFANPLDPAKRKIGSPGPAFGNEAKIIDAATGRTLPPGAAGEIMVRGDNVMTCYYKDPENTAKTLEPDRWMHTGDVGYLDADGFLFVTGRIKEIIIKGGENIAPREIDEALLRHPAVLEAAAVGIPDANYGQEIMACVVLKPGSACTVEELAAFSQRELGKYKAPKVIRLVTELPKGPSGKVQRLKLLDS